MRVYQLRPVPPDRDPQMREMIGLAKGFVCDGSLNDAEALALQQWLFYHSALLETSPVSQLGDRLLRAVEDGHMDDEERKDLVAILSDVTKLA
jgi:hypothetical protein